VRLAVHDVAGREVRRLQDAVQAAGDHEVVWNGEDNRSQRVARGVYWIRLSVDDRNTSRKMLLLR
jgi:flagellar hook assembly protein FlgD